MPLSEQQVDNFCLSLREINPTVHGVCLRKEDIGDEEAIFIAESLRANTNLQYLFLPFNRIGVEGGIALAKVVLKKGEVSLCHNKIGTEGALAFATVLKANSNDLRRLCLGSNEIGPEGVAAIAKALSVNVSLEWLCLYRNQLGNEQAKLIARALEANTTLKYLKLAHNDIGTEGARALLEAIQEHNGTLIHLNLYGNEEVSDSVKRQIDGLLEQNSKGTRNPAPTPKTAHL